MFTKSSNINLSVKLARELHQYKVDYNAVWLFLLHAVAKTWIQCEFVAKALNLSMRLLPKDELSMKLLRTPELSIRLMSQKLICHKCSFWL